MPFDFPEFPDDREPDYSRMSHGELLVAPNVPTNLKNYVMLELQRIGFNVGLLKISDFLRRDLQEEEAYVRARQDELQRWLDAMQFQALNSALKGHLRDEKTSVIKDIDVVNSAIGKLEAKGKKKNAGKIQSLKRVKEGLIDYKNDLSDLEKERGQADNLNTLQKVAQSTQKATQAAQPAKSSVRSSVKSAKRAATPRRSKVSPTATPSASTPDSDQDDDEDDDETMYMDADDPTKKTAKKSAGTAVAQAPSLDPT